MKNEIQEMFEILIDETGLDAVFHHGTEQTALRVVPGASNTEVAVDYGIAIQTPGTDFLILGTALKVLPKLDDYFMVGAKRYDVVERTDGCRRWSDPYHVVLRVHVSEVAE